jgi:hypothetical protein
MPLLFGARYFDELPHLDNPKSTRERVPQPRGKIRNQELKIVFLGHLCYLPPKSRRHGR